MPARSSIVIPFPLKGYNEGWAFRQQPEGTTPSVLNVRPFGELERRLRGGQREGITKYVDDQVDAAPVYGMGSVTRAISTTTIIAADTVKGETFTQADGLFDPTEAEFSSYTGETGTLTDGASADTFVAGNKWVGKTGAAYDKLVLFQSAMATTNYVISCTASPVGASSAVEIYFRAEAATGNLTQDKYFVVRLFTFGADYRVEIRYSGSAIATSDSFTKAGAVTLQVINAGSTIEVLVDGILRTSASSATIVANAYVGFGIGKGATDDDAYIDNVTISNGKVPDRLSRSDLVVVCNGDVYSGDKLALNKATGGDDAMYTDRRVAIQQAYGSGYLCDGAATHYKVIDTATSTVSDWTPTAGSLPVGSVDASLACKIACLYRGRLVLSGLIETPHNWFMSAVGDPLDWDYAPTTTSATQAVAGNNSDAGLVGDVITALIPYSDDLLLFGCDHQLWMLRGDPAAGGVIDAISYQTGVAGPESWAFDPNGVLYFFGSGQMWRMQPGQTYPESLSTGRLDRTFRDIDIYNNRVSLVWDVQHDGLHMFVISLSQPSTGPIHFFWDRRTDGWWRDQYPDEMGPSSAIYFHDPEAGKSGLLLGGWDGYIRTLDDDAVDDDGTDMTSHVDFAPLLAGGDVANTRLTELTPVMGVGSGAINMEVYAAETAEAVVAATTPRFVKALAAGRNQSVRQRANGNAIRIRLSNPGTDTITWALEALTGIVAVSGKTRRGHL